MRKTKGWIVAAVAMILVGAACIVAVTGVTDMDYSKLNTVNYVTDTVEINDDFSEINIESVSSDIAFKTSKDGNCSVVCFEPENRVSKVYAQSGTLFVKPKDNRKWFDNVEVNFSSPSITVFLPKDSYDKLTVRESAGNIVVRDGPVFHYVDISSNSGLVVLDASVDTDVKISTYSGDISVKDINAAAFKLETSSGDVTLKSSVFSGKADILTDSGEVGMTDISCAELNAESYSGDFTLKKTTAKKDINISGTSSDVKLENCDAANLSINTYSGDVSGKLLSGKRYIVKSSSGYVRVPESANGGNCKIVTASGDIDMK